MRVLSRPKSNPTSRVGTFNLAIVSLDGSNTFTNLTASPKTTETMGRFSPDGSPSSTPPTSRGRLEVYVRPVGEGGRVRISTDGGEPPIWDPDGSGSISGTPTG